MSGLFQIDVTVTMTRTYEVVLDTHDEDEAIAMFNDLVSQGELPDPIEEDVHNGPDVLYCEYVEDATLPPDDDSDWREHDPRYRYLHPGPGD